MFRNNDPDLLFRRILLARSAADGFRMMQKHGLDWYLERAHASTPLDLQICRSPETVTLVRDACAHLAVQGTRTFVRDMQMFHAPVENTADLLIYQQTEFILNHIITTLVQQR